MALHKPVARRLQVAFDKVFIWHQRHPDLEALKHLAWSAGLVVVIYTDASGECGWGAVCGDSWQQGQWTLDQLDQSINWKELAAYAKALEAFANQLRGKLVLLKCDNTSTVHYVNHGTGRIAVLANLARAIRLQEIALSCESVAIHLPGSLNVTADALSRLHVQADLRDPLPHRTFRRKLFLDVLKVEPSMEVDGFVADDKHNSLLPRCCTPSDSFFEHMDDGVVFWLFPPLDMIDMILSVIDVRRRNKQPFHGIVLLPESPRAPWFRFLQHSTRLLRYRGGSDLFRVFTGIGVWGKCPPVAEAWVVVRFSTHP